MDMSNRAIRICKSHFHASTKFINTNSEVELKISALLTINISDKLICKLKNEEYEFLARIIEEIDDYLTIN